MDEICGLKFHLSYVDMPPCAHHIICITEFVLLIKTFPFYEVGKMARKWRNFKKKIKVHPDFILTG